MRDTSHMIGNGCGHSVLTPYSGTLTSKNYPGTYPNFTFCEWRIYGAAGSQFSLTFGDMDIEASEQCKSGFLLLSSPSDGSSFDNITMIQDCNHATETEEGKIERCLTGPGYNP
ncbi:hypothetical protein JD844_005506 [Phrynosoma platyrhinos]|uniref:CUB domain-containing protein n=1 Tax=Phrynosoma platyrhinos TaxID=52577 RepID=A0ABQ7TP81_PHRPL|nr:hypothetical protein JD844_005506 [Phrynosoma platyrhinos]